MAKEKCAVAVARMNQDHACKLWYAMIEARPDKTKAAEAMIGFSLSTENFPTKEEAAARAERYAELCGFESVTWIGL